MTKKGFFNKATMFEIVTVFVSLTAGTLTILQNVGFLSFAEENIIKAPNSPIVIFLAFLLVVMGFLFINKRR